MQNFTQVKNFRCKSLTDVKMEYLTVRQLLAGWQNSFDKDNGAVEREFYK